MNENNIHLRYIFINRVYIFKLYLFIQGGFDNMELAKAYFCQAAKLNPNNIRALYGLLLVSFKMAHIILDSNCIYVCVCV